MRVRTVMLSHLFAVLYLVLVSFMLYFTSRPVFFYFPLHILIDANVIAVYSSTALTAVL